MQRFKISDLSTCLDIMGGRIQWTIIYTDSQSSTTKVSQKLWLQIFQPIVC